MARRCELTGSGPGAGNQVSHSNSKTRTRWLPNLQHKRYTIPELGETMRLRLSTRAMRTIDKLGGISNAIRAAKSAEMSPRLRSVQARLRKRFEPARR